MFIFADNRISLFRYEFADLISLVLKILLVAAVDFINPIHAQVDHQNYGREENLLNNDVQSALPTPIIKV